jgi:O-succinylbenzoate-CoA ligase
VGDLVCPLRTAAQNHPDTPALISGETVLSYEDYDRAVSGAACRIRELGFEAGDRLGFLLPPSPDYVTLLMACFRAGVVACPLSTRLPAKALESALQHLGCGALLSEECGRISPPLKGVARSAGGCFGLLSVPSSIRQLAPQEFLGANCEDTSEESGTDASEEAGLTPASEARRVCPSASSTTWPSQENQPATIIFTSGSSGAPKASEEAGLTQASEARRVCPSASFTTWPFQDDQPATIIFTSGSSGVPKAALHTLGNHIHNARASNRNIPIGPGDRWLLSLPLFHVAGLGVLFRCLLGEGTVAVPDPDEDLLTALRRYEVTHVSLVATQLQRLLAEEGGPETLKGLKAILLGGSAVPATLVRQAHDLGLKIATTYGLTETASQMTTTRPGDTLEALLTSGRPLTPGTIRTATDGAIQVRGETLFAGYVEGDRLDRPVSTEGWFDTGDLGAFDDEGCLHVQGRKDNLFISGGENIQPEEVEEALCRLPGVAQAIVVPVEDAEFGHRPVAFLRFESEEGMAGADVNAELAEILSAYKIPVAYHPWPAGESGTDPSRHAHRVTRRGQSRGMKIDRKYFWALARTTLKT